MILAFVDIMKSFIFSLMFFIVGIIIGFGLLMLVYLIITKIAKKKVDKPDEIIPNMAQKPINEIISLYVGEYNISYSNKTLSKRIGYVKDYSLKMIEDIAESYYPNEKNPILSISLEDSVKLSKEIVEIIKKYAYMIIDDSIVGDAYKVGVGINNAFIGFKNIFKKDKQEYLTKDIHALPISKAIESYEKIYGTFTKFRSKKKNKKEDQEVKEYQKYPFDNKINNIIVLMIEEIGGLADKAYGKNFSNNSLEVVK